MQIELLYYSIYPPAQYLLCGNKLCITNLNVIEIRRSIKKVKPSLNLTSIINYGLLWLSYITTSLRFFSITDSKNPYIILLYNMGQKNTCLLYNKRGVAYIIEEFKRSERKCCILKTENF